MAEEIGRLIGGKYRLEEVLGEGANGVVWRARDELLHRDVAIKEVRFPAGIGADEITSLNARTLREARAAAGLKHPGIIVVHEVILQGDHPWIVMELIKGRTLQEIIRGDGPQPPGRAAEIGAKILAALRVAHAAGVVHRDIKPSNVLLEDERVVVTDFGIAALDGATILTRTGALLGTPAFMSLEQARGRPAAPASDLWSLGATLYAMVEGHPPFTGESTFAVLAALLTGDYPPPEHAGPLTPVIDGLLVQDPSQRMSAEEAAGHLALATNGDGGTSPRVRPPDATPETTVEDPPQDAPKGRWFPLPRVRILTILAVPVVLLAAAPLIPMPFRDQTPPPPSAQAPHIGHRFPSTTLASDTSTFSVAFSPDGKKLAVGSADSTMRWWADSTMRWRDVKSYARTAQVAPHASSLFQVRYSPDGKQLATACADGTVRLWNGASDAQPAVLTGHNGQVSSVAFTPDGKRLASGGEDGTIRLWNATTGALTGVISGYMGKVFSVSFSRDGKTLAGSGSKDGTIRLWNVASRTPAGSLRGHPEPVNTVAFSRDGRTVASGSWHGSLRLWDIASRKQREILSGHTDALNSVAFSPDGKTLASGGEDDTVLLWDVATHTRLATLTGHRGDIYSVAFSTDGKTLATGAADKTIRLWDLTR